MFSLLSVISVSISTVEIDIIQNTFSQNILFWFKTRKKIEPQHIHLARVVQRLDNAIHRINRYPVDKCWQNKPRYPLDSDLSGG